MFGENLSGSNKFLSPEPLVLEVRPRLGHRHVGQNSRHPPVVGISKVEVVPPTHRKGRLIGERVARGKRGKKERREGGLREMVTHLHEVRLRASVRH